MRIWDHFILYPLFTKGVFVVWVGGEGSSWAQGFSWPIFTSNFRVGKNLVVGSDLTPAAAVADPGALGAQPPCPQEFFKIMQFFRQFYKGKPPILSKFWAQVHPPWGQISAGPPDQNPGSAPELLERCQRLSEPVDSHRLVGLFLHRSIGQWLGSGQWLGGVLKYANHAKLLWFLTMVKVELRNRDQMVQTFQ